jgi:hypothetical protein
MSDFKYDVKLSRFDANTNLFLGRELESVDKTNYEELNAGSLARDFFSAITDVDEWDIVYTYKMFKMVGKAKVSSRNNDDNSRVGLTMTPASRNVKEITDEYGWTVSDIQRAAKRNVPLDRMTAMAAKTISDRKIDDLLAFGDSTLAIEGALKLSDAPAPGTASTKTSGTKWEVNAATDAAKIIKDVGDGTIAVFQALKQTKDAPAFQKLTALVPTDSYGAIATTPRSTQSDTTILKFLLASNPWLDAMEPWFQCDTASDGGGSGTGRMMLYPRNPLWGGALVPMEFRSLNPQERGQEIIVPTRASCGGVICRYAVATYYLDGV